MSHLRRSLFTCCCVVVLAACLPMSGSATSCRALPPSQPVCNAEQPGWCWAAAISWCATWYRAPEAQCIIATYFCLNLDQTGGCGPFPHCCVWPVGPCANRGYSPQIVWLGMTGATEETPERLTASKRLVCR